MTIAIAAMIKPCNTTCKIREEEEYKGISSLSWFRHLINMFLVKVYI